MFFYHPNTCGGKKKKDPRGQVGNVSPSKPARLISTRLSKVGMRERKNGSPL